MKRKKNDKLEWGNQVNSTDQLDQMRNWSVKTARDRDEEDRKEFFNKSSFELWPVARELENNAHAHLEQMRFSPTTMNFPSFFFRLTSTIPLPFRLFRKIESKKKSIYRHRQ